MQFAMRTAARASAHVNRATAVAVARPSHPSPPPLARLPRLSTVSRPAASVRAFSTHAASATTTVDSRAQSAASPASSTAAPPRAALLDGAALAHQLLDSLHARLSRLRTARPGLRAPHLAVILASEARDSERYVQRKSDACARVGITSRTHRLDPSSLTLDQLLSLIDQLNSDPGVDGILVQLPLPAHLSHAQDTVLASVSVEKDVDGFHPRSLGQLALDGEQVEQIEDENELSEHAPQQQPHAVYHVPCTPKAVMRLLDHYSIPLRGRHVAVLGRSAHVGLPLTLLLLHRGASVSNIDASMSHSQARAICAQADVLVSAVGRAEYVDAEWVKHGAAVVDVGINFVQRQPHANSADPNSHSDSTHARFSPHPDNPDDTRDGLRLVGDVHAPSVAPRAAFLTPVPGGVGPMTVAALMDNTFRAWRHRTRTSEADERPAQPN